MAEYFTGTGHYGYECVPNRYGYEYFSENEELDRYHNCLRMLDHFLENLFDQYKRLGLYENTIFVLFGDHGEGFREHGRELHGDTIWEEGLWIPLIVHDPKRFESGERVEELASQIDILPTVLDLLGYEVENGEYPGYSLLRPLPKDPHPKLQLHKRPQVPSEPEGRREVHPPLQQPTRRTLRPVGGP